LKEEKKMKKTKLLILVFISALILTFNLQQVEGLVPPETEWDQTYGGAGSDTLRSVVQTSDGGYALAGYTWSFGAGFADFWLVKVAGPPPVPEFPMGLIVEISLAPVIVYLWWKLKHQTQSGSAST